VRENDERALELRRKFESEAPHAPLEWRPHSSCCLDFLVSSPPPLQSGAVSTFDVVTLSLPALLPSQLQHP
jgi:hypothetical protein